jgi:hypothetical protein
MNEKLPIRDILIASATALPLLGACKEQPKITEGIAFKKERINTLTVFNPKPIYSFYSRERQVEGITSKSATQKEGIDPAKLVKIFGEKTHSEDWNVYIAQCPNSEPRSTEKYEQECVTASLPVSQEEFAQARLGHHFQKPELAK